jgi:hypothetical protein
MCDAWSTKQLIAAFGGVFTLANILVLPAVAAENGAPNTLAYYDPRLAKAIGADGPLFSRVIPRSNAEPAAPGDFVEKMQAPDGSQVRVLVKAPAPAEPGKILKVAPLASGESANDYFSQAINEAVSGGYAAVSFRRRLTILPRRRPEARAIG